MAIEFHCFIIEYRPDGHELRVLYKRQDGTNQRTVIRRRKVLELARLCLQKALKAYDVGDAMDLGSSAFTTREDALFVQRINEQAAKGV